MANFEQVNGKIKLRVTTLNVEPLSGKRSGSHGLNDLPLPKVALASELPPPRWDHSPGEVVSIVKDAIAQKTKVNDQIAALPADECSFESIPLAEAEGALQAITESMRLYQEVAPEESLRKASVEATTLTDDFNVEDKMRLDVFRAKANAEKNIRESGKWDSLTTEDKRVVDRMVLEGKRAGLDLPDEEREKLAQLQKELSAVCSEFGHVSRDMQSDDFVPWYLDPL
ncbi:hypothetical protein CONPUDRAFT_143382 [Coniophora puteana RWD-64-598 SS2]|uniref:Uncharacterized protein n=1 Tax=Coniophora puteana (strain RWD-64-598) TaxID=741705 RepID=A0A5M3MWH7_CONPW|nr:uncharacterized protein CONPUDRAFT_143382 [Coniophora puteana RWD-64-598 SS2]EIW83508.1 hypothetical protein CONPUDRAFT_143382 [Coniophora puteana RWD-64-598 SS2]